MNMRKTSRVWFPKLIFMSRMSRITLQLNVVDYDVLIRNGRALFMMSKKSDMKGEKEMVRQNVIKKGKRGEKTLGKRKRRNLTINKKKVSTKTS